MKTIDFIKHQIRSHHNDFDEIREMEECEKFAKYGALIMYEHTLNWLENNLIGIMEPSLYKDFIENYKKEI